MAGTFAHGTTLTIGSAVSNLRSISGIGITGETIDVTTHDSEDGFREFIGGLKDGGEISIGGVFDSVAGAGAMYNLVASGEVTTGATIVVPTTKATTFTFDCIVTSFQLETPHDGIVAYTGSIKVTGKPKLESAV